MSLGAGLTRSVDGGVRLLIPRSWLLKRQRRHCPTGYCNAHGKEQEQEHSNMQMTQMTMTGCYNKQDAGRSIDPLLSIVSQEGYLVHLARCEQLVVLVLLLLVLLILVLILVLTFLLVLILILA